jgi:enediyne biosynthesis protein E3
LGSIAKLLFGISPRETSLERRGFRGGAAGARDRMDNVVRCFLTGYHAALEDDHLVSLVPRLEQVEPSCRGFAYEGAAMGLALLDWMTPWNRRRVSSFLREAGDLHAYMVHVGAGWVLARVPGNVEKFLSRFDPLLRWLLVDGYGFHEGFFRWPRYLSGQPAPARLQGYARRAFDQGLGRCLWFIEGADVSRIATSIAALSCDRHSDLWSGVGLASVYAGGASEADLRQLKETAGHFAPHLAQGAAFAAKARLRAGNLSAYHDAACRILCDMSAPDAAQVTDAALEDLPADGAEPSYETWRRRIQQRFAQSAGVPR